MLKYLELVKFLSFADEYACGLNNAFKNWAIYRTCCHVFFLVLFPTSPPPPQRLFSIQHHMPFQIKLNPLAAKYLVSTTHSLLGSCVRGWGGPGKITGTLLLSPALQLFFSNTSFSMLDMLLLDFKSPEIMLLLDFKSPEVMLLLDFKSPEVLLAAPSSFVVAFWRDLCRVSLY